MSRACLLLISLFAATNVGLAQAPAPKETVVIFTVEPAAAPVPALKYQLLPELKEMNPGNPIQGYLKCFGEQRFFFYDKTSVEQREKWLTMPLSELPLKELRGYGGIALRNVDYAARLDLPDWQILLQLKKDPIGMPLPDIQQLRDLAGALKVRFRGEIAERRFDDAIFTLKTMFALPRHLGEHPTMIGNLLGAFIAHTTLGSLEEMIQVPGCPNLYWALTYLPDPFIDFRWGLQGLRVGLDPEFDELDVAAPASDAQLQKVITRLTKILGLLERPKQEKIDLQAWLKARVTDENHLRGARERLIAAGLPKNRVKEFPAQQVLLLDEKREYEVRRDEAMKWFPLPFWQAHSGLLATRKINPGDDTLFRQMGIETLHNLHKQQARLERRIALLRHVEALRLHAAENGGKLPETLEKVNVPLPVDPYTGKQFNYNRDGFTATLRGTPPQGEEASELWNVRYVVTFKK